MRGTAAMVITLAAILFLCLSSLALAQNSGFVRVQGTQFMLKDRPVYFAGTNNYYQMLHRSFGRTADADEVLDKLAARSMNLLRTWAFQDAGEYAPYCLMCAPARALEGNETPLDFLNEDTFRGLDQTLAAADARGIRVILAFVNNWPDYGGIDRWTLWRFGAVNHDQFYTDATLKQWYKQLVSTMINRVNTVNQRAYRDDPTILAWEVMNEPRTASSSAAAATALNAWIGEMSAYIKSLDANHLVTTGMEGFYSGTNSSRNSDGWMNAYGQDFIVNHQHATIDFATCHIYPDGWGWNPLGQTASAVTKAGQFLQRRINDCNSVLHKPLLLEEFGVPRDNFGKGINSGSTVVRDQFYQQVFYGLTQQSAGTGGAAGGTAMWILFDDNTANYDDGNGVFLPQDASTDVLAAAHAHFMGRLRRGDLDSDGDVDQSDFGILQSCLTAIDAIATPACANADFNNDQKINQADLAVFKKCRSGPDNPADPNCVY